MSQASPDAEDHDEGLGPSVPEPPRRVPFAVTVTVALLGLVSVLLLISATAALTTNSYYEDSIGEAAAKGLATAAIAVSAALVAAVAWSFVRNGNTVGPMAVGVLLLLAGLIGLGAGVISESDTDGLRLGVVALVLGLGVILVPLLGHGPSYLAARRVWARAEREWLHDLATPEAPPPMPYQPQWGGQHSPPQPQWGAPPQQQPAYPQQYQYPPQPNQPQPGQPWPGPQQPQQYEAWHQAAVPGPAWTAQPSAQAPQSSAQASAPPAPVPPATAPPSATPPPQQAETTPAPYAAAQQAPTEHIRTAGTVPPQGEAPPPQQPS